MAENVLPSDYSEFLSGLKERIRTAQVRAALSVNRELVLLYWQIGRDIQERQERMGWGAKVIERLAHDLKAAFPEMQGLSSRNLKYMRAFAESWPDQAIVQQVVAQIPWGHNVRLLDRLSDRETRLWYARQTIENGWSRPVLEQQIASGLHERQGKAITNFERTLPSPQSDLAQQLLKDPYNFDFLTLHEEALERDLERGLLDHIRDFLLELGTGFAFVGSQVPLVVSDREYRLDLLFYHVRLHCYVVVELKRGEFQPEYAGKMNFYLAAVDHQVRDTARDERSIGLILCKSRDKLTVEYALYNTSTPIGISAYHLADALPDAFKGSLPSIEELEAEFASLPDLLDTGGDE
jgi:predicted nuclease of restriction endonuclease-like (RecB) superfamily